jgi:sulfoxide reductase heme-binding subunit YedZ
MVLALLAIQATPLKNVPPQLFNSLFEQAGRWAVRLLLVCLAMTPLHRVFGWRAALKLRKPLGLWAFAFASIHFVDYFGLPPYDLEWLQNLTQPFILLGIAALILLTLLAVTSNQWAMRRLKKWWKRLHRLVYGAALLGAVHGIIAASNGKKAAFREEIYIHEIKAYLVVLVVLLVLRLPIVHRTARKLIVPISTMRTPKPKRAVEISRTPVIERYIEESDLMESEVEVSQ